MSDGSALAVGLDPLALWMVAAAMLAAAGALLYLGVRAFWRLRTIVDTPTARIQSAPQGYSELAGLARPHLRQTAGPLTGRPCLWYRYRVDERRGSGRNRHWARIAGGDCPDPFLLDDGTGRCIVEPAGAHLRLSRRVRWVGPNADPRSRGRTWPFAADRYRFTEERIEDGDPLYILGYFETPRRGAEERERLRRSLLKIWKQDPVRLARFDRDGDGQIGLDEWELVRREAAVLAERAELEQTRKIPVPRVHATGDPRQPYLVSTRTQEELAATLRWQALGASAGALALGVAAAILALARLRVP